MHRGMEIIRAARGLLAAGVCLLGSAVLAETGDDGYIAPQPLGAALKEFAEITGLQVIYLAELADGVDSQGADIRESSEATLSQLLTSTGLDYQFVNKRTVTIGVTEENPNPEKTEARSGGIRAGENPSTAREPRATDAGNLRIAGGRNTSARLDEIVTTGSRISNSNWGSSVPTRVIGLQDIDAAGSVSLGEILEQIPGVALGLSPESTVLATQNAGLTSISLRNLGSNRTLTLIDGRRVVSNSGNAQRVDLGTIPAGFVERVEVVTGGASAVYGSDAVAGVANIILRDNYDGLQVNLRYGDSADGGEQEGLVDVLAGTSFPNDKGNVLFAAAYDRETPVFGRDRDWAVSPVEFDRDTGEFEHGDLSSRIPGGRFEGDDAWHANGTWYNDRSIGPPDDRDPRLGFETALDGFNPRPYAVISPFRERFSAAMKADFDFLSNLSGFTSLQFSSIETEAKRAAASADDDTSFGEDGFEEEVGNIAADNPFIPSAVEETRNRTVSWRRRFTEVGPRLRASDRDTVRAWFGLEGSFAEDRWNWSAFVSKGNFRQRQVRDNELNLQNLRFGLNVEEDPANPGSYRCDEETARAAGCVPVNLFGAGSLTPEMADYVRATDRLKQELDQTMFGATVVGPIVGLPAGTAEAAFGVEYRKEEQRTRGDPATQLGLTTTGTIPDLSGEYEVREAFVELGIPLIGDRPWAEQLNVELAGRVAEYDTIGNANSWKVGLSWAVTDDVRIKTQASSAQRAPNITELFSAPRSDFDTVNDPCAGVTASSTGLIDDNCRSVESISNSIAVTDQFRQATTSVFGPNAGNSGLDAETSETFTAGIVFTPTVLEGFSLVTDYYDIKIDNAIVLIGSQDTVDYCYGSPTFPDNRFCDAITRDGSGQLSRVSNRVENISTLSAKGIDVALNYHFELPFAPGDFEFRTIYTYVIDRSNSAAGPDGPAVREFTGEVGFPEHEYLSTLVWNRGDLHVRYRLHYLGTGIDDNRERKFLESGEPNPAFFKFEQNVTHDVYAQYAFGDSPLVSIFAGINNIDNETGPFIPDGFTSGGSRNFDPVYDPIGRFFYAGLRMTW